LDRLSTVADDVKGIRDATEGTLDFLKNKFRFAGFGLG